MGVETAVAVVIADRVGGAEIRDPAGFEQRNQPGLVLAGDGHGPGHGESERAAHADGPIDNGVDAAQKGAAEGRETVPDQLVQRVAFIDAPHLNAGVVRGGHPFHATKSGVGQVGNLRQDGILPTRESRVANPAQDTILPYSNCLRKPSSCCLSSATSRSSASTRSSSGELEITGGSGLADSSGGPLMICTQRPRATGATKDSSRSDRCFSTYSTSS